MQRNILIDVVERLSLAATLEMVTTIVAEAARALTGADGTTFVLRENESCYYANENAISPLWKGRRFPLEMCISGWSILNQEVAVIPDIYKDPRIPHDAYRATFVKSLCMVPIRSENPLGAIGSYWSNGYVPTDDEVNLLQILANSAAIALENLQLKESLIKYSVTSSPEDREKELEAAMHTIAHDLRNPLSTMMLFAELLRAGIGEQNDVFRSYIDSILETGTYASEQIRKMLALYTVRNHKLERRRVNLSVIASDISSQLKARTPKRQIFMEIEEDLIITADPHLMRLAVENMISNAFKYTSKKSQALVEFKKRESKNGSVVYFVRDNGDGFHPEDGHKLFRPLMRLHHEKEFQGVGLGLASTARIIELHGGRIWAEGQKSVGATFYFELPVQS